MPPFTASKRAGIDPLVHSVRSLLFLQTMAIETILVMLEKVALGGVGCGARGASGEGGKERATVGVVA